MRLLVSSSTPWYSFLCLHTFLLPKTPPLLRFNPTGSTCPAVFGVKVYENDFLDFSNVFPVSPPPLGDRSAWRQRYLYLSSLALTWTMFFPTQKHRLWIHCSYNNKSKVTKTTLTFEPMIRLSGNFDMYRWEFIRFENPRCSIILCSPFLYILCNSLWPLVYFSPLR